VCASTFFFVFCVGIPALLVTYISWIALLIYAVACFVLLLVSACRFCGLPVCAVFFRPVEAEERCPQHPDVKTRAAGWCVRAAKCQQCSQNREDARKLESVKPIVQSLLRTLQKHAQGSAEGCPTLEEICRLVYPRLQRVRKLFPSASDADLCDALLTYSPESALFAKGHESSEKVEDGHWGKYQGELYYGSDQAFHNGAKAVIGEAVPADKAIATIVREIVDHGVPEEDWYNLWYIQHCSAVEQANYDAKGKLRVEEATTPARAPPSAVSAERATTTACGSDSGEDSDHPEGASPAEIALFIKTWGRDDHSEEQMPELPLGTTAKILDAGHGGMRLHDFTEQVNSLLKKHGSDSRVTDAQVLALRLYTSSTFRRLNTSLRDKGQNKTKGDLKFKACVQFARTCVLALQAVPREKTSTFRGATGYLSHAFQGDGMGMDYAFFSTSLNEQTAAEFAGSADHSILFEIEYLRGCPGADCSMLSLYPGEKEVLFPPCTGLNVMNKGSAAITGQGAGQARVVISPTEAV
jgi:hypothetical protein